MMKKVLLTRSSSDNKTIIDKYRDSFYYVNCPLLFYNDDMTTLTQVLDEYNCFIVTSKHLASLIAEILKKSHKVIEFYVVGAISANIIKNAGGNIQFQANNVRELIDKIIEYNIQAVYLSGNNITHQLPNTINRFVVYKTKYKTVLSSEEINAIKHKLDYILIFSTETAKVLLHLYRQHNLLPYMLKTIIITISAKVAKIVRLYCKNVLYCKDGKYDQMMTILKNHATSKKRSRKKIKF